MAKKKYDELLKTPRARGSQFQDEIFEILQQLKTALDFDELTFPEYNELKNEFIKIDFNNLSAARAALTQSKKLQQN